MYFRFCTIPLLAAVFLCGCSNNERPVRKEQATTISKNLYPVIRYKGITIRLHQLLYCSYPAHDPVYLQKRSTTLLLMDISVSCDKNISAIDKAFVIPTGATLRDNRGNEYEASPQAVAMAQNNHCIKGDDIESYNAIWNAALKTGETKRAFVLGFELPEDAVPAKLCWNKAWEERDLFFVLADSAGR